MARPALLIAGNAGKHFGHKAAFKSVSFSLGEKRVLAIAGPNGGGKTTLLRCILGIYRCDQPGAIRYGFGADSLITGRRRMAYAPDDDTLIDELTGREFLEFVADMYELPTAATVEKAEKLLQELQFEPADLGKLIRSYSHGMRKKLQLASALALEVPLTLIDEPTNGLDPSSVIIAKQLLKSTRRHGSLIVSSHNLNFVSDLADDVLLLNHRPLAYGSREEVLKRAGSRNLESAYKKLVMETLSLAR